MKNRSNKGTALFVIDYNQRQKYLQAAPGSREEQAAFLFLKRLGYDTMEIAEFKHGPIETWTNPLFRIDYTSTESNGEIRTIFIDKPDDFCANLTETDVSGIVVRLSEGEHSDPAGFIWQDDDGICKIAWERKFLDENTTVGETK